MKHYTFESLRCIFMFAIFCGHLEAYKIPLFQMLGKSLGGDTGVTFFFLLSGFVAELSFQRKGDKKPDYLHWLGKKIYRFYPLHIATMLLALPFLIIKDYSPYSLITILLSDILLIKSLIPCRDYYFALNGVSWFLSTWLILTAISPYLHRLNKLFSKKIWLFSLVILHVSICLIGHYHAWSAWATYISPFFRTIDFLIGMALCSNIVSSSVNNSLSRKYTIFESASLISPFLLLQLFPNISINIISFIGAFFIFYSFSPERGHISHILRKSFIAKLGSGVYIFFLIHQLIIEYTYIAFNKFHLNSYFAILTTFTLTLIVTYLITTRKKSTKF